MNEQSNEPNKDTNKDPKKEIMNDFEMGEPQESFPSTDKPKINNYTKDIKAPDSKPEKKIDPSATPPPESPDRATPPGDAPQPQQAQPQQPQQSQPVQAQSQAGQPQKPGQPPQKKTLRPKRKVDPVARKKALFGCLGGFGAVIILLLIFSFIFIAQSSPDRVSPIAQLFGIDQASFINGLIIFVHLIFIVIALGTFTFTMIGLFKAGMAKRDDKITRKKGLKMSMVSGVSLILVLVIWAFTYLYMDAKRIPLPDRVLQPIMTEPEDTLGLTGPIEIIFDASNVPVDRSRYVIVAYEWEFGDGNTGTGQITSNTYENVGVYDVMLAVRARDINTGETGILSEYTTIVSIDSLTMNASFTATPQSGEAPLEVEFDASDSSHPTGRIARYRWDFTGDGIFDDEEGIEVTHTFERAGNYTVTLQIVSTLGETAETEREIEVFVAEDPVPVISVLEDPEEFFIGTSYTFRAEDSHSPNGRITDYRWDFGDGSPTRPTMTASHTFQSPGTYEVALWVKDETEKEAEKRRVITVRAPIGVPTAVMETVPAFDPQTNRLEGVVPFEVQFDAGRSTDPDDNIVDYRWDFGDGSEEGSGVTTTHTFREPGDYTVKLSVLDADGNVGEKRITVSVEALGIVPVLEADRVEGTVPLTVAFDASGSSYEEGEITGYRWDFGDGSAPTLGGSSITYRYNNIGVFTATVTVMAADGLTADATLTITVRETPLSACFESVFTEGQAPLTTTFDAGCSTGTITRYLWDFGGDGQSTSPRPTHTFENPGEYQATLEVTDVRGTIDTFSKTITVTE